MRTRQHVFDEAFVTGNVNEAKTEVFQLEIGKAEVDRNAASFFFRKTVGIGSGQSAHERALSVIDMTRGADNQGRHNHRLRRLFCEYLLVEINVLRYHEIGRASCRERV